jgi:hypothetical protein
MNRVVYVRWYGPLSPARQIILNILILTFVTLSVILSSIYAINIPWTSSGSRMYVDSWKLNEKNVCDIYQFNHEQYVKWLSEQ